MITSLMFMTLIAAAVAAIAQFLWFLRRSRNRAIASDVLAGDSVAQTPPDGALPEIVGLIGFALLAMALLVFGYGVQNY